MPILDALITVQSPYQNVYLYAFGETVINPSSIKDYMSEVLGINLIKGKKGSLISSGYIPTGDG